MQLGQDGPEIGRFALGCMSMSFDGVDDDVSLRTLQAALDAGVVMLDTADRYGRGHNEELVGRALRGHRDGAVVATKLGFVGGSADPHPVDGSPAHIAAAARASLDRLGIDAIDLLYLHRVDPRVPVEDSVGALAALVAEGLVRRIGLSEVTADTLRRAHAVHPVAAVQSEYSLWTRDPEASVLPACRELGATFVAYSPLGSGFLTGAVRAAEDVRVLGRLARGPRLDAGNLDHNLGLVETLVALAAERGCTPAQMALAWVMAQDVVALPGSAQLPHLRENLAARDLTLSEADRAVLARAFPPGVAAGARKSPSGLALVR